jgi:hypothetical protein
MSITVLKGAQLKLIPAKFRLCANLVYVGLSESDQVGEAQTRFPEQLLLWLRPPFSSRLFAYSGGFLNDRREHFTFALLNRFDERLQLSGQPLGK